jgi:glycine dehydrogenase subunit 2
MSEPLIYDLSNDGVKGYDVEQPVTRDDESLKNLSALGLARADLPGLPQVCEVDVVRHFTRLSELNFHLDKGLYPLGSCTMKYNPKVNERLAGLPGFANQHPLQGDDSQQGTLEILYRLQEILSDVTGFDAVTLQPCAGAHGELTALMMVKAYFTDKGEQRKIVVVPDSAHGTNPASAAMCGYTVKEVPSNKDGCVDVAAFKEAVTKDCACVMLTNPNTLGIFEKNVLEIAAHCKSTGTILYCDGANMNALVGKAGPGQMGFDIMHLNLHKTFSTPHGGGGPGSGPVACSKELAPFLPKPVIVKDGDKYKTEYDRPKSIGSVHTFFGNIAIALRAFVYLRTMGLDGLKQVSEIAVLNANYLKKHLSALLPVPYDKHCMHEFVMSGKPPEGCPVHTMDMAKRLLDLGFHAPTVYFPLIVEEAMMVEPTETESKAELDKFIAAFRQILGERDTNPELLLSAPLTTPVRRLDETSAARNPNVKFCPCGDYITRD